MTAKDVEHQSAVIAYEHARANREAATSALLIALTQLLISCQPFVDQAIKEQVANARNNRTQR
jgi:hypothetical protein